MGLMSITGEPDGPPLKVGVAIADVLTGLYAAQRLDGARRSGPRAPGPSVRPGPGRLHVGQSGKRSQSVLVTGERPRRWGNAHPQIVPYETFETADGHLVIGVGTDDQWRGFAPRSSMRSGPLTLDSKKMPSASNTAKNCSRSCDRWMREDHAPLARAIGRDWSAARSGAAGRRRLTTPQVAAREMILPVVDSQGRSYSVIGSAVHWQGEPPRQASAPPRSASIATKCCTSGSITTIKKLPNCVIVALSAEQEHSMPSQEPRADARRQWADGVGQGRDPGRLRFLRRRGAGELGLLRPATGTPAGAVGAVMPRNWSCAPDSPPTSWPPRLMLPRRPRMNPRRHAGNSSSVAIAT